MKQKSEFRKDRPHSWLACFATLAIVAGCEGGSIREWGRGKESSGTSEASANQRGTPEIESKQASAAPPKKSKGSSARSEPSPPLNVFRQRKAGSTEAWTIECWASEKVTDGAEMAEARGHADQLVTALKRVKELNPQAVRLDQTEERCRVFYGDYKLKYIRAAVDNPRESQAKGDLVIELTPQIKRDLQFIRSLASADDNHPFFAARVMSKPTDDLGPRQYDLRNAKGVYTLHVGATYNTDTFHDYKRAAVEWVTALRKDGEEAYYYHHPDKQLSDICVGTFGEDALVEEPGTAEREPSRRYSEAVVRLQARFPFNLENGMKVTRRLPDGTKFTNQSFLVRIPPKAGQEPSGVE